MDCKLADEKLKNIKDARTCYDEAVKLAEKNQFQLAQTIVEHGLEIDNNEVNLLNLLGFLHYKQGRYLECRKANELVLSIDKENVYAMSGLGISLCALSEIEAGIEVLKKSAGLTDKDFMEPYMDLISVLLNLKRVDEARGILKEAKAKSTEFWIRNLDLYNKLEI